MMYCLLRCYFNNTAITIIVERLAERLRRWTQGLEIWGSIPASPVMCKSLGQALNPHCLWPPSSNGYLGHVSKVGSTCAGCALVAAPYRGRKRVCWICMHRYQTIKSVPLPLPLEHDALRVPLPVYRWGWQNDRSRLWGGCQDNILLL